MKFEEKFPKLCQRFPLPVFVSIKGRHIDEIAVAESYEILEKIAQDRIEFLVKDGHFGYQLAQSLEEFVLADMKIAYEDAVALAQKYPDSETAKKFNSAVRRYKELEEYAEMCSIAKDAAKGDYTRVQSSVHFMIHYGQGDWIMHQVDTDRGYPVLNLY